MKTTTRTEYAYDKAVCKWIRLQPTLERWCKAKKIDFTIYQVLFEEIFAIAAYI